MCGSFKEIIQLGRHLAAAWTGRAVYGDFVGITVHPYFFEFAFRCVGYHVAQFRMEFLLMAEIPYQHGDNQA